MLTQHPQPATTVSIRACLRAHIEPEIHLPSLVRLLDVLAHIALLADKLNLEIKRILVSSQAVFSVKDKMSLKGVCDTVEVASVVIWRGTLQLRELVRRSACFVPYGSRVQAIAKALLSTSPKLKVVESMLKTYFGPRSRQDVDEKPGESSRTRDGSLYLSASPTWFAEPFAESTKRAWRWLDEASTSLDGASKGEMESVCARAEDVRSSMLDAASQVFDCMDIASNIFDTYDPADVKHETLPKQEIDTRESPDMKNVRPNGETQARGVVSTPDALLQRARLGTSQSISTAHISGEPDKRTALARQAQRDVSAPSTRQDGPSGPSASRQGDLKRPNPSVKAAKKRGRPSFPPREGPDYTRPLPTASINSIRQRLHPFQAKDLK